MRLLVELVHTFKMFARSLPRMFRQHFVAAPLTPRSTFSKFSSVIKTNVHRQKSGLFSTLSHFDSKPQTCPQIFRAFSLSQGSSRTSPAAFSTRSFFSSSDGPRPAFSEVISILKLKVGSSSVSSEMHHSLMLQTALSVNQNNPQQAIAKLAQMQQAKIALNSTMKFIDSSK